MGEVLFERLRELARRHPRVGDVRGKGLLACLELVRDRTTHAPLVPPNTDSPLPLQIRRRAWDEGIHLLARGSLILLAPPLIVQPEHIDEAVAKLDRVLSWAWMLCRERIPFGDSLLLGGAVGSCAEVQGHVPLGQRHLRCTRRRPPGRARQRPRVGSRGCTPPTCAGSPRS